MKKTAIAPSNIAFIKYWGKKDENLRLPANGSISMNLSGLTSTTTVEFAQTQNKDRVVIDGQTNTDETKRVIDHLDRIRKMAGITHKAKVVSRNNFPSSTGLSSSASGFAALTLAATTAAGLNILEKDLSILARLASGSACRSIPSGFVEWLAGKDNATSYAVSIYPPHSWDIVDVVAVVSYKKKEIPTTVGQKSASSSPFFQTRILHIQDKIRKIKNFIKEKNFLKFGEMVEEEALELHAVMLTSKPPLFYLQPETVSIMHKVRKLREDGLPVYFTVNTGQDIHLICEKKNADKLEVFLRKIDVVRDIIINTPAQGAKIIDKHLF